jgi:Lrp/AsnC family transcriptional regulator, leucine-responsive regulatory protein
LVEPARDRADFHAFTRRGLFDKPNIRRFTTNVVMSPDKVGHNASV